MVWSVDKRADIYEPFISEVEEGLSVGRVERMPYRRYTAHFVTPQWMSSAWCKFGAKR